MAAMGKNTEYERLMEVVRLTVALFEVEQFETLLASGELSYEDDYRIRRDYHYALKKVEELTTKSKAGKHITGTEGARNTGSSR